MKAVVTLTVGTREQAVTSTGAAKWWLSVRSPAPLIAFRVAAAACLLVHFVNLHARVPGAREGWHAVAVAGAGVLSCSITGMLAFGVWARACAASLYVVCVALGYTGAPFVTVDDYAATLLTFILIALPLGTGLAPPWRIDRTIRLPGSSTTLLLLLVGALYGTRGLSLLAPDNARAAINALALVPILLILPSSIAQKFAVTIQVLSHAYLIAQGGSFLLHGALASTACLFWGEPAPRSPPASVWDAGAVVLTCVLVIAMCGVALELFGFTSGAARAAVILRHAGLVPPAISLGR